MDKFGDLKGLRILAFPCSQFTVDETTEDTKYKFHVFGKVEVNGESASPLWKYLKLRQNGGKGSFIKWNFTKFIINKLGVPVDRFDSGVQPLELVKVLDCYW
ncbi:hypothetical protein K1T71_001140 [Dendrolimus kikuchii]|uniref:Uncharacterized protein n=1 Tax=Dendrolimus kikuchii TaxID=765133 RepID=A0ACC1DGT0_9NEOP|nr:hypothetical protein K1T71_001140 [Dendrolimus kikuchii]